MCTANPVMPPRERAHHADMPSNANAITRPIGMLYAAPMREANVATSADPNAEKTVMRVRTGALRRCDHGWLVSCCCGLLISAQCKPTAQLRPGQHRA